MPEYPLALFAEFLNHAEDVARSGPDTTGLRIGLNIPGYLRRLGKPLDGLANVTAPETIDFDALCKGCAQLREFRDSHGKINEPLWYAGLGVLAFSAGGDDIAKQWSAGHPSYSATETRGRLNRARALSGPTTCQHFKSLAPERCAGCRFGTSTPLEAARENRGPEVRRGRDGEGSTLADETFDPDGQPLEAHPEYVYKEGALYLQTEARSGKEDFTKITSFPVEIKSIHLGEINKAQNFYLVRHLHPHDGWSEFDLPASDLVGQHMVAAMADIGVVIHDGDLFRRYVRDSADTIKRRERTLMQFEQMGWKGANTEFLYGDVLYTREGKKTTACSQELRYRAQWMKPKLNGSAEKWKEAVDNLFGKGSEGMSFSILASFAAPLMRFLEDNEGGAIVSLVTKHSGAGKTTALAGAYTVWASDARAISLTTIDTKVSKGITLGALCNLPLVYDEFSNKDPEVVRDFILMFTSGRDKNRADGSGHILHAASSWQTILLAASNRSLVDTITSQGESDAPTYRILEFPVESSGSLTPSEASRLKKQLEENAGHAGEAYLEYIMNPDVLRWVIKDLEVAIDEIFIKGKFRKEHRYWVRTLAACAVAATIVRKLGLISFEPDRIIGWAVKYFSDLVGEVQRDKGSQAYHLSSFLNEHISETLTMPGPARQGRQIVAPVGEKPRVRVCVRVEIEGYRCYICEPILRKWIQKNGGGYTAFMRELKETGIVLSDRKQVTLTAGTDLRSGVLPCVEIDWGHPALTGELRIVMGGDYKQKAEKFLEEKRK